MADRGAPMSYLTLEEGTPVLASDGTEVGRVEHVLADADADIFDGLVVHTRIVGAHPDETAEGDLARKLRRAWELISGRY